MSLHIIKHTTQGALALGMIAVLMLFSAQFTAAGGPELREYKALGNVSEQFVPGEVVFRYHNDSERFRVMEVPDVEAAVAALAKNPNIEYVEPNFIASAFAVPNDPYYQPYQWHFDNPDYGGVHAEAAWDTTAGAGTVVAVIDTGVAYEDHTDGRGRWRQSYSQAPDLAGTCFVDGYDFVNNDTHANDDNAHGTHVAGTIAQTTNNGEGVAGLAHDTCIMPVKALDSGGFGSYTAIANAIYFAADNGADVINMSLGGSSGSSVLEDAVAYAYTQGVTILAAAGNSNGAVGYPAAYDDYVIAVGATRYDEARAPYSSNGPQLDIVAPGGDVSVDQNGDGNGDGVLQQTFNPNTRNTSDFNYWFFQGTSMATPHAAAAAAMVLSGGNATTPDEIREALQSTADDLGAVGRDDFFGHGIINVPAALAWTAGPVDNPPSVTLTVPSEGATVSGEVLITASSSDDGSVSEVRFSINGELLGSDTTSPYEMTWNTASSADGSYTVTAIAIDDIGQTGEDNASVTVDNVNDAPIADAGPDQSGYVGDIFTFSGSGSSDDRGLVSFDWDFGDGSPVESNEAVSHSYAATGIYTVTLTVIDTDGVTSSDTATVTVEEEPAVPTEVAVDSFTITTEGGKNSDKHLNVTPLAHNDFNDPVGGAVVDMALVHETDGSWTFSGETATDGTVQFSLKNAPAGTYTATITNISAAGLTWDSSTPAEKTFSK